jgi:Na+-transporting methylmalonyl-CoA/oxaloacetate decarboxylase gamma subunit
MPTDHTLPLWARLLLSAFPYVAAVVVHVSAVINIWSDERSTKAWWSPLVVAPVVSVLYPMSKFGGVVNSSQESLILIGVGIGTLFLLFLILGIVSIGDLAGTRGPTPIKIPRYGYVMKSELLVFLSVAIILFEMAIALVLAI